MRNTNSCRDPSQDPFERLAERGLLWTNIFWAACLACCGIAVVGHTWIGAAPWEDALWRGGIVAAVAVLGCSEILGVGYIIVQTVIAQRQS